MRILGKFITAALLLFFVLIMTAPSTADIISTKIRSHNRNTILFSEFEYSHTGYVSVKVSSVGISSIPFTSNLSQPDPSRIGFFLLSDELSYRYRQEFKRNPDLCPLDIKFISVLFTFRDLSPPPQSSFNKSYHVIYPGVYSLYFANCNDLSLLTMDVRTELYNTGDDGTTKDYLSAGQPQPFFYLSFFLIYLCLLGFLISISVKNQQCVNLMHLQMGLLLVTNLLYFMWAVAVQHDLKVTGIPREWYIFFYIIQFIRDIYFFGQIVLIGAGCCNWRRFLPRWILLILSIVILLRAWASVCFIMAWKSGPYSEDWMNLRASFTITDIICGVVVFLHTFCSAVSFKMAKDTSTFVRSYSSLKEVTSRHDVFPFLLFVYIIFTRGLNVVLQTTALQETCTLVFSIVMLYMYRPFPLGDEDQKCVGFIDHTGA